MKNFNKSSFTGYSGFLKMSELRKKQTFLSTFQASKHIGTLFSEQQKMNFISI